MRIEDEQGYTWIIESTAPSWPAVKLLKAKGYEKIILPFEVICGTLASQPEPASGPTIGVHATAPESLVRAVRLADCLDVLRGESNET